MACETDNCIVSISSVSLDWARGKPAPGGGRTVAFFWDPGVRGELFEEVKQSAPVCEPMDTAAPLEEKATIDKKNPYGRPCLLRDYETSRASVVRGLHTPSVFSFGQWRIVCTRLLMECVDFFETLCLFNACTAAHVKWT